jgi:hypothetical protein
MQRRTTTCTITALALSLLTIGFGQTTLAHDDHPHAADIKPAAPVMPHKHDRTIAIPAGQAMPSVKLVVVPDAIAGWNMEIQLTNFTFNPAQVNQSSKTTEGHAHLLLNDRKVARIYGTWNHIPKLPQGKNVLKVVLMTNQHETLTANGQPIVGEVTIDVPITSSPAPKNPDAPAPAKLLNP